MTHQLVHEPPLQLLPTLAVELGVVDALLLQRIFEASVDAGEPVACRPHDWYDEMPFLDPDDVTAAFDRLRARGLLAIAKGPERCTTYTLDEAAIRDLFPQAVVG